MHFFVEYKVCCKVSPLGQVGYKFGLIAFLDWLSLTTYSCSSKQDDITWDKLKILKYASWFQNQIWVECLTIDYSSFFSLILMVQAIGKIFWQLFVVNQQIRSGVWRVFKELNMFSLSLRGVNFLILVLFMNGWWVWQWL
jgi:hypothetical protein